MVEGSLLEFCIHDITYKGKPTAVIGLYIHPQSKSLDLINVRERRTYKHKIPIDSLSRAILSNLQKANITPSAQNEMQIVEDSTSTRAVFFYYSKDIEKKIYTCI